MELAVLDAEIPVVFYSYSEHRFCYLIAQVGNSNKGWLDVLLQHLPARQVS